MNPGTQTLVIESLASGGEGVGRLPDGRPVLLRGINEGTWGQMRDGDATMIRDQGAGLVRLLIRWWGLYGGSDVESRSDSDPGHFDPAHVARLLQELQWCHDAGLWAIVAIDSNCGQNGLQSAAMASYCDPAGTYPGGRNFWTDLSQRQRFKEAWIYLAGRLRGLPNIAFYELLPEPLEGRDSSYGAEVSAFYQELMAAIEDQAQAPGQLRADMPRGSRGNPVREIGARCGQGKSTRSNHRLHQGMDRPADAHRGARSGHYVRNTR